jgi:ABC-type sugar transport system ATPase subunit
MAGIVIRELTKVYDDSAKARSMPVRAALEGLNLEVAAGELLVVVGPSGSGKSTLVRLVAGLERPTAGSIHLAGRDLRGVPPQHRDVALVFQSLALYEHLTVEQNLAFALNAQTRGGWWSSWLRRGTGSNEAQSRIIETARLLRIESLLGRRPDMLSGGEQQRVALGRAIVRKPQALLLDEPLSSLDLPTRRTLRRELKELQRTLGVPTIYVTHDQAEALAIGDRIAVLDQGRLAQVGTPKEIYERPKTRFVGEFFGPQGMNTLEGKVAEGTFEVRLSDGTCIASIALSDLWSGAANDGPVFVGIRPEDVTLLPADSKREALNGTIVAIDYLGDSTYAQIRLRDNSPIITARISEPFSHSLRAGTEVQLSMPPHRLVRFDDEVRQ